MQRNERSVFGYFSDQNEAEGARQQLVQAGISDVQLGPVSRSSATGVEDDMFQPTTGQFDSVAKLTMGADVAAMGDDTGTLLSSEQSSDEYAEAYTEGNSPQEAAWMVVAVTDGSDVEVERTVKIMKSYGANV